MKSLGRILSLIVVASAATLLMNCDSGSSDEKSVEEVQLDKLKGTWSVTSAIRDDSDDWTSDYNGVTLSIDGTYSGSTNPTYNFSFSGVLPDLGPWPKTGTWRFTNPENQIMRLNDNQSINYSLPSANQLIMTFNYQGPGFAGGRVNEVGGDWEFVFTEQ